jgi:hypothetical protein
MKRVMANKIPGNMPAAGTLVGVVGTLAGLNA